MAYLSHEQVEATDTAKTVVDLTLPGNATHVELQASTQQVRYTMDGTSMPAQTVGMILAVAAQPKAFLIRDLQRIIFVRGAASNGNLELHYFAGRDV